MNFSNRNMPGTLSIILLTFIRHGITEKDYERIRDAFTQLGVHQPSHLGEGLEGEDQDSTLACAVTRKKLKGAKMYLTQEEIEVIMSGNIKPYLEAVEQSIAQQKGAAIVEELDEEEQAV